MLKNSSPQPQYANMFSLLGSDAVYMSKALIVIGKNGSVEAVMHLVACERCHQIIMVYKKVALKLKISLLLTMYVSYWPRKKKHSGRALTLTLISGIKTDLYLKQTFKESGMV